MLQATLLLPARNQNTGTRYSRMLVNNFEQDLLILFKSYSQSSLVLRRYYLPNSDTIVMGFYQPYTVLLPPTDTPALVALQRKWERLLGAKIPIQYCPVSVL